MSVVHQQVRDFVSLLDPEGNTILNMSPAAAVAAVRSGDPGRVRAIDGAFAIVVKDGLDVKMARSIGRPMRYFMAKQADGPLLVVAERIDEIHRFLESRSLDGQFRPEYTRMVPAHHVVTLRVVGCPDPNPEYVRFLTPQRDRLPADLDEIGRAYVGAMADQCRRWLRTLPEDEPIGVTFSGGIDSGSIFLVLYHSLLELGLSPQRLKAFTLSVEEGPDVAQARAFLDALDLSIFHETVEASPGDLDVRRAIEVIEDYKRRDVEAATTTLALCRLVRERYPLWKYLADGDGGDENLKAYPIEENPELTIRSVLGNPLLYHEGWGIDRIKHSLTYSGGQSRGTVRTWATARRYGFSTFSPYTHPEVIEVSEAIPFIALTNWEHDRLYALKGEVVARGVRAVTGLEMPINPKRRMQEGTMGKGRFGEIFGEEEVVYRDHFASLYA